MLGKLGEQIGRKADEAAPDDPTDALIVAGRKISPASDKDRQRAEADGKADQQHAPRPDFGWVAEDGRHAHERYAQEPNRQSRQRALDDPPSSFGPVDRRPQREQEEPGIGGGLHHEENDVLRQKHSRPKLEPGPELKRLAGIELDHIDEEAPGHGAWARPHQPSRAKHNQDPGNRVEHNDDVEQAIGGPRLGGELDSAARALRRRRDDKRRLASRHDVSNAAPLRQQTRAPDAVDGRARHRGKIEPISGAQTGSPSRRIVLAFERTPHVVDASVAVHGETERAQWMNDPEQVRGDHRDRIEGQKQKNDAAEKACAISVSHQPMLRGPRRGTFLQQR